MTFNQPRYLFYAFFLFVYGDENNSFTLFRFDSLVVD